MLDRIGNAERQVQTKLSLMRSEISNSILEYHKAHRNKPIAKSVAPVESKLSIKKRRMTVDDAIENMVINSRHQLSGKDKKVSIDLLSRINDSYKRCQGIVSALEEKDVVFQKSVKEQSARIKDMMLKRRLRSLI